MAVDPVNLEELTKANQKSLDLLTAQARRLEDTKSGQPAEDQCIAIAAISDLETQIRTLEFTRAHLRASRIIVPFDDGEAAQLRRFEGVLNGFIPRDSTVKAMLASISPVMTAAEEINALINSHTAPV